MSVDIGYKEIIFTVITSCLFYFILIATGKFLGANDYILASACTASAILTGSLVAFCAFRLNYRISQEPITVIIKELHKEFWNDPNYIEVRSWLCSNSAYEQYLLPVLKKRISGPVDIEEYSYLEKLDKYLALMLRVTVNIQLLDLNKKQEKAFCSLGYGFWIKRLKSKEELEKYIKSYWQPLHDNIDNVIKMSEKYFPNLGEIQGT